MEIRWIYTKFPPLNHSAVNFRQECRWMITANHTLISLMMKTNHEWTTPRRSCFYDKPSKLLQSSFYTHPYRYEVFHNFKVIFVHIINIIYFLWYHFQKQHVIVILYIVGFYFNNEGYKYQAILNADIIKRMHFLLDRFHSMHFLLE